MNKAAFVSKPKKKVDRATLITIGVIVAIYALAFGLEQVVPATSMLFTVLKKGATYALVAVSMNLLNGFTGLFSLGQAGFMLIGAYTYAIFTVPVANRLSVYRYYDGGIIQFTLPVIVAIVLAGLAAAFFAFHHRPAGAAPQERLPGHRHPGLCGDHPRHLPVGQDRRGHQRLQPPADVPELQRFQHQGRGR